MVKDPVDQPTVEQVTLIGQTGWGKEMWGNKGNIGIGIEIGSWDGDRQNRKKDGVGERNRRIHIVARP